MSERRKEIYVSSEVLSALIMLAERENGDIQDISKKTSADAIADAILKKDIQERYPQIFDHQKQIAQLRKDFVKTL